MEITLCPQGTHPWVYENIQIRGDGSERCRLCKQESDAKYRASDAGRERQNANHRAMRARNKAKVIEAYGGMCACCEETETAFLVLDHINGGGNQERKEVGGGARLYVKLIKEGFPPGYQVLCCNCNHAKHFQGECPHQTARYGT